MEPRYGPPPDPTELAYAADFSTVPVAWVLCVGAGLTVAWFGRRSAFLAVIGLTVALTSPAAALFPSAVWGAWPTIDKAGSLHFLSLNAQFHSFDPSAPATQLIGMSMGHLWVTWLFSWFFQAFAASNLHAILNLVLGWWLASRLAVAAGTPERWAIIAGFPMGPGLHLMRDINWYTIEKSGTWTLTLFVLCLVHAQAGRRRWIVGAAAAYALAFYYNSYHGVLGALAGAGALIVGSRNTRLAVAASALAALPLLALQLPALRNAQLPPPEAFSIRAALDVVTLAPPEWNRLELWRAVDGIVALAALATVLRALRFANATDEPEARRSRVELLLFVGLLVPAILSLGPTTPLWTVFQSLPGMWRFAKPEAFFHLVVLGMTVLSGRALHRGGWHPRTVLALQIALWIWLVRMHPAYPGFTQPPLG